jgi:hypothetical protein
MEEPVYTDGNKTVKGMLEEQAYLGSSLRG